MHALESREWEEGEERREERSPSCNYHGELRALQLHKTLDKSPSIPLTVHEIQGRSLERKESLLLELGSRRYMSGDDVDAQVASYSQWMANTGLLGAAWTLLGSSLGWASLLCTVPCMLCLPPALLA